MKRRIIYNEEGIPKSYADVRRYLDDRLAPLVGSQVDSVSWCVGQHMLRYPTQIPGYDVFEHNQKHFDAGQDPLQMIVDFCRAQRFEVFGSLRMNDTHDATMDKHHGYRIKREHPEWLVEEWPASKPDSFQDNPLMLRGYVGNLDRVGWYYSALDYARLEVRDRFFAVVEEVCRNYDVDGMELDFLTMPMFFRPSLHGQPARPEHIGIMTGFIRRIRNRTKQLGDARGRQIELAVRVPRTLDQGLFLGLDVETWMSEGLIDIVVPGGRCCPFTIPVADWVRLGRQYRVHIYPCLSGFLGIEFVRAQAMYLWSGKPDGIYLFNYFAGFDKEDGIREHARQALSEIGDPTLLSRQDKIYTVTAGGRERTWAAYRHVSQRYLPVELNMAKGQSTCTMPVMMADDLPSAQVKELTLELEFQGLADDDEIVIKVNGISVVEGISSAESAPATTNTRVACPLTAPSLHQGENELQVTLARRGWIATTTQEPLILDQVRLHVRYNNSR